MPPMCAAYAVPPMLPLSRTAIAMFISAMNTTSQRTFIGTHAEEEHLVVGPP